MGPEVGPSFPEALAELALEIQHIAREGGREALEYLDELLTTEGAAKAMKVEPQSLYRWACAGCGPRRVKLGGGDGPVRYQRRDLLRWLEERSVEPSRGAPRRRRNHPRHQTLSLEEIAS